jgi:metal-responsive CopG/Arc/MetJ family transcriptional regulator
MSKRVASKVWATIPDQLAEKLDKRAGVEGRSRSDLISYLLERAMESWTPPEQDTQK